MNIRKGAGMERLTIDEIIEHCDRKTEIYEKSCGVKYLETTAMNNSIKEYWENKQVAEYLRQLKEYQQLEEHGGFVMLPCKVGDTVYKPNPVILNEIVEIKIESMFITESNFNISGRTTKMKYSFCCTPKDFGKTVFLTKSEAVEKLKEMEGKLRE